MSDEQGRELRFPNGAARGFGAARLAALGPRYLSDREGTGAIEFALIVPVLLVLYMGGLDVCLAVSSHKKMQHAASVVGDLVTRGTSVTANDIDGMFNLSNAIMKPRADKLASIKVTAIQIDKDGKAKVAWSRASGTASDGKNSAYALPASFSAMKNAFLVKTETTYQYTPLGGFGLIKPIAMAETALMIPRVGASVTCADCN